MCGSLGDEHIVIHPPTNAVQTIVITVAVKTTQFNFINSKDFPAELFLLGKFADNRRWIISRFTVLSARPKSPVIDYNYTSWSGFDDFAQPE